MEILKDVLCELEQGQELSELAQENLVIVVYQLEDVRGIAFAEDEAKKTKIMGKGH